MKHFNVFIATLILAGLAFLPATARADDDDWDDLDVTMEVVKDLASVQDTIARMEGPGDVVADSGDDSDGVSDGDSNDDSDDDRNDGSIGDSASDDETSELEDDDMDGEDEFEEEDGDDLRVDLRPLAYDHERLAEEMRAENLPEEFIETIPFTETRFYVRHVLANREAYRRLYGLGRTAPRPANGGARS